MSAPAVSVIIPTFNRADLLPATLESVLGQSFADLEIIVVDDGSTDNTEAVVRANPDRRIRYIRNAWSGSPAVTRNVGIRQARGAFLAFVDSDDLWLPGKIAAQMAFLAEHPECGWCFTHCHVLDHATGGVLAAPIPEPLAIGFGPRDMLRNNLVPSPTPLVRRELLGCAGPFCEDPALRFVEDWELWLRLFALNRPGYLPEPLALYRRHPANATGAAEAKTKFLRCVAAIRAGVAASPQLYAPHYAAAVRTHLGFVTELLLEGDGPGVRQCCETAKQDPGNVPELAALELLSRLPGPMARLVLALRRSLRPAA